MWPQGSFLVKEGTVISSLQMMQTLSVLASSSAVASTIKHFSVMSIKKRNDLKNTTQGREPV